MMEKLSLKFLRNYQMFELLIVLLAYIGISYLWDLYGRSSIPNVTVDSWYDVVLSYPKKLIEQLSKKS